MVFWVVTPCSDVNQRFGGLFYHPTSLHGTILIHMSSTLIFIAVTISHLVSLLQTFAPSTRQEHNHQIIIFYDIVLRHPWQEVSKVYTKGRRCISPTVSVFQFSAYMGITIFVVFLWKHSMQWRIAYKNCDVLQNFIWSKTLNAVMTPTLLIFTFLTSLTPVVTSCPADRYDKMVGLRWLGVGLNCHRKSNSEKWTGQDHKKRPRWDVLRQVWSNPSCQAMRGWRDNRIVLGTAVIVL